MGLGDAPGEPTASRCARGVSHLAVVALETLHNVNALCELGIIELPMGTFSNRVVASGAEGGMKVTAVHEVDLDEDLDGITPSGPLPPAPTQSTKWVGNYASRALCPALRRPPTRERVRRSRLPLEQTTMLTQ
jgi:hypothetical protein